MNSTKRIHLLIFLGLLVVSCYSSRDSTANNPNQQEPAYRELIDLISAQPGVQVKKAGGDYDILIRSKGTLITSHQPLFVIDGMVMGTRYSDIASAILVTDIQNIRILKGSEATVYGSRGGNGVIEIYLKKGQ